VISREFLPYQESLLRWIYVEAQKSQAAALGVRLLNKKSDQLPFSMVLV
jgi:hypothetical protein